MCAQGLKTTSRDISTVTLVETRLVSSRQHAHPIQATCPKHSSVGTLSTEALGSHRIRSNKLVLQIWVPVFFQTYFSMLLDCKVPMVLCMCTSTGVISID